MPCNRKSVQHCMQKKMLHHLQRYLRTVQRRILRQLSQLQPYPGHTDLHRLQ